VLVNAEASLFSFQAIGLQIIEGCFGTINFKETSSLGWVASILGQTYLNGKIAISLYETRSAVDRVDDPDALARKPRGYRPRRHGGTLGHRL